MSRRDDSVRVNRHRDSTARSRRGESGGGRTCLTITAANPMYNARYPILARRIVNEKRNPR